VKFEFCDVQWIDVRDRTVVVLELDASEQTRYRTMIARRNLETRAVGKRDNKWTKLALGQPRHDLCDDGCCWVSHRTKLSIHRLLFKPINSQHVVRHLGSRTKQAYPASLSAAAGVKNTSLVPGVIPNPEMMSDLPAPALHIGIRGENT
jgi:hypothetical protein